MTTFYVDFENGTDDDGTTVAKKRYDITGLDALAGDTVKIVGSPDPTLLGTGSAKMGYGDYQYNGLSIGTITLSTTAGETTIQPSGYPTSPSGLGFSTGDTVQIVGDTSTQNMNGTWQLTETSTAGVLKIDEFQAINTTTTPSGSIRVYDSNAKVLYVDSTPIVNLASTGPRTAAFTAATNVTCTLDENTSPQWSNSNRRTWEHAKVDKIEIADGHGTGLAAYIQISQLSSSTYEQVSFYAMQSSGQYANMSDGISLRLCTGTDGTGSVKSIPLDFKLLQNGHWIPIVKDFDEALTSGGNINSIALYVDTDRGARTIHLSNIVGCKAADQNDSITHKSLIGLNTTADPVWRPIESIRALSNGKTRIVFPTNKILSEPNGYYGAGRTAGFADDYSGVNIYKRECLQVQLSLLHSYKKSDSNSPNNQYDNFPNITSSSRLNNQSYNGTSGNQLIFSGGWSSDFSSQNLQHSIIDTQLWYHTFKLAYANYVTLERLGVARLGGNVKLEYAKGVQLDDFIIAGVGSTQTSETKGIYANNFHPSKFKIKAYVNCYSEGFVTSTFECRKTDGDTNAELSDKANFEIFLSGAHFQNQFWQMYSGHYLFNKVVIRGQGYYAKALEIGDGVGGKPYIDELSLSSSYQGIFCKSGTVELEIGTFKSSHISQFVIQYYGPGKITINDCTNAITRNLTLYPQSYANTAAFNVIAGGTLAIRNGPVLTNLRTEISSGTFLTSDDSVTGDYASAPAIVYTGSWQRRNANQVSGAYETFIHNGIIRPDTSIRKTASGYSWKCTSKNYTTATEGSPLTLKLGQIAVNANSLVTVKVWTYRTNTSVFGKLRIGRNDFIGLTTDQTVSTSGSTNTWIEIQKTFTPNAAGFVQINLDVYTTQTNLAEHVYFDDVTITQA